MIGQTEPGSIDLIKLLDEHALVRLQTHKGMPICLKII